MEKTTFAGLTKLDSDESILDDGAAFIGRDREIIDLHLERGSKTHRHTGLAGLSNPVGAPSGTAIASGGSIAADLNLNIGFTLQDNARGETLMSPVASVTTPSSLDVPVNAPTAALDYAAGSLTVDTYYYAISYVDAEGGETPLGPPAIAQRQPGYANARVLLSGLTTGMATASAAGWRLYRLRGGGDYAYLASGTSANYTDDGSVSPICDVQPPDDDFNTTNGVNSIVVDIPTASEITASDFINLYASEDGDFSGAVFLEQFPVASAGQSVVYRDLVLLDDQPPDVSTAVGDAPKIDPDTELEGNTWKRPVVTVGNLPGGADDGDIRAVASGGTKLYVASGGFLEHPAG